jgi:hypothetical protein
MDLTPVTHTWREIRDLSGGTDVTGLRSGQAPPPANTLAWKWRGGQSARHSPRKTRAGLRRIGHFRHGGFFIVEAFERYFAHVGPISSPITIAFANRFSPPAPARAALAQSRSDETRHHQTLQLPTTRSTYRPGSETDSQRTRLSHGDHETPPGWDLSPCLFRIRVIDHLKPKNKDSRSNPKQTRCNANSSL